MSIKRSVEDLAINGGPPGLTNPVHVNKPFSAPRSAYEKYFDRAWDTNWFTNDGPLVRLFEKRLANHLAVEECVLTTNGTAALELTLRALAISGEVILPSFTFVSTANVLSLMGIVPVFCDVDPETHNLCPQACARLITERTTAIIPTHVWGRPCPIDELEKLCDQHGLKLIFDSAHAFGCKIADRFVGSFGDAEVFSLHATKSLHAFEGGFVSTNNLKLARTLRISRNFGFTGFDQIEMPGTNAKMSESHAAMGLANLDVFDNTLSRAKACFEIYRKRLSSIPGLTIRPIEPSYSSNYHYVVAEIEKGRFGMSRDRLVDILRSENVLARRYFYPGVHKMTPHMPRFSQLQRELPFTEKACSKSLVLPAGAAMTIEETELVCDLIRFLHNQSRFL